MSRASGCGSSSKLERPSPLRSMPAWRHSAARVVSVAAGGGGEASSSSSWRSLGRRGAGGGWASACATARRANTKHSLSELDASRLAPCRPVLDASPTAYSPAHAHDGGGVELQQLEVGQRCSGGVREQQPDALRAWWVGGARPQRGGAARRDHDGARGYQLAVVAEHAAAAVLEQPQRASSRVLEHADQLLFHRERGQLAYQSPACRATAGVHDATDRVPSLEAERKPPEAIRVEADPESL